MKLYQKLLLGFALVALLVGCVGYVAQTMNARVEYGVLRLSESAVPEVEHATAMALALRASQEAARGLVMREDGAAEALSGALAAFEERLAAGRAATVRGRTRAENWSRPEDITGAEERLAWISELGRNFESYREAVDRLAGLAAAHGSRLATFDAGLAQIGEFSFILAGLGTGLGVLPPEGRDLILAGAIFSILINPFIFTFVAGRGQTAKQEEADRAALVEEERQRDRREHVILVGYGRVGRLVAEGTGGAGRALVVIEDQQDMAARAKQDGYQVVIGNAVEPRVLEEAGITDASKLIIAIPEGFEGGVVAEHARQLNPEVMIFARAHSDDEVRHLEKKGADKVIMGEREIARTILALAATTRRPDTAH